MALQPGSAPGVTGDSIWKTQAMQRALSVNNKLNVLIANDYDTDTASSVATSLSGTVTYDTGLTGGVARVKTGAALGAWALVYNAGGSLLVGSPRNESWFVQSRCWTKTAPLGATNNYHCVGIQDVVALGAQRIAFGYFSEFDQTYLSLVQDLGGGAPFVTVSNVPGDLSGFHDYAIGRDFDNDKLYAIYDGAPIIELDGPFLNMTTNPCFSYAVAGSTGGNDIEMWTDNIATVVQGV